MVRQIIEDNLGLEVILNIAFDCKAYGSMDERGCAFKPSANVAQAVTRELVSE